MYQRGPRRLELYPRAIQIDAHGASSPDRLCSCHASWQVSEVQMVFDIGVGHAHAAGINQAGSARRERCHVAWVLWRGGLRFAYYCAVMTAVMRQIITISLPLGSSNALYLRLCRV